MGNNANTFWTPENDAKLIELVEQNKSGPFIAEALGITRNAVLGRKFRLGLCSPVVKKPKLKGKSLEDLNLRDCRFPITDEFPFRFCGKKAQPGSPYCKKHHSKCYRPAPPHKHDGKRT